MSDPYAQLSAGRRKPAVFSKLFAALFLGLTLLAVLYSFFSIRSDQAKLDQAVTPSAVVPK